MNNITEKQNQIIADLTKEFAKINESVRPKSLSFIDDLFNETEEKSNKIRAFHADILSHCRAVAMLRNELAVKISDQLSVMPLNYNVEVQDKWEKSDSLGINLLSEIHLYCGSSRILKISFGFDNERDPRNPNIHDATGVHYYEYNVATRHPLDRGKYKYKNPVAFIDVNDRININDIENCFVFKSKIKEMFIKHSDKIKRK